MRRPLLALMSIAFVSALPAQPLELRSLPALILANDATAGIAAQTATIAWHGYQSTIADALPKIDLSSGYTLGYTPLIKSQAVEMRDQAASALSAKISITQILPTAGSLLVSLEDTMSVNATGGKIIGNKTESPDPLYSQKPRLSIGLSQPLFLNGKLLDFGLFPAMFRKAQIGYSKEDASNRDAKNKAVLQGVELYLTVVQLRARRSMLEKSIEIAQGSLAKIAQSFRLGAATETDLLEGELAMGGQKSTLLDARAALASSERALARSIGREDIQETAFGDELPAIALSAEESDLLARAYAQHPLIQKQNLAVEEKQVDDILAGQRYASMLNLSFSFSPRYPFIPQGQDPLKTDLAGSFTELFREGWGQDYTVTASLVVRLFDGGKEREDRAGAKALGQATSLVLELQRQQVREQITSQLMRRANLEEKIALAASIADLSRRRLEIERSLLALGRSTELDVESRRLDVMTKTADLWRARADLLLVQLSLASAIGEDLAILIEGPSQ